VAFSYKNVMMQKNFPYIFSALPNRKNAYVLHAFSFFNTLQNSFNVDQPQ